MRWITLTLLALLLPVSPAFAGTATTPNVCQYSVYRGYWFDHAIDLSGTASPASAAPGSGVTLTGAAAHARLPDWVAEYATNLGIFKAGDNAVPAKVWLALAGDGSAQGVQVVSAETVAHTVVTVGADGAYQSSTPFDVTLPLPDTAWTAPGADGTLTWRQAPAGSLPAVQAGAATVTPRGSVLILAQLGNGLSTTIDCLPGTEAPGRTAYNALAAPPFESIPVQAGATALPAPAVRTPLVKLRTTKLKRTGKRVAVAVACAAAACKGKVTLRWSGGAAARTASYSLAAGARKTLRLTLSAKARRTLKRKSVLVQVKITVAGGKTVTKKLRLK
ncbi:MAG TPA: hypothetical protein VNS09_26425 [Solirubrobacter sp.]|nr:hypothetical protein [Solirubrobacter sp.]